MTDEIKLTDDRFIRKNADGIQFRNKPDNLGQYVPLTAANPTNQQHLATKAYVDSAVLGLTPDIVCQIATTKNINLANEAESGDAIDDVIIFAGDKLLVKDQTDPTENGVYVINTSISDATKYPIRIGNYDLQAETLVYIERGTINAGADYALAPPDAGFTGGSGHPLYGTDPLIWVTVTIPIPHNINDYLDIKSSVLLATTININLASPGANIDGIPVPFGARILVKNQTTKSQNGIYIFDTATTPMVRSNDANAPGEIVSGLYTFVTNGVTNINTGWVLTTPNPIIINTTPLIFQSFNGVALPILLNTINNLTPTLSNVIIGNGTTWTSRKELFNSDLGDVVITNLQPGDSTYFDGTNWVNITLQDTLNVLFPTRVYGDIVYYDGTNFVNSPPGSISGVQPYDSDLSTIAGFTHTAGNTIRSNGTVWQNTTLELNDLGDVDISSPILKNLLMFDGTSWVNDVHDLTDHNDVTLSALNLGQLLYFNGTAWTNQFAELTELADVNITTPIDKDLLAFDGTTWKNLQPAIIHLDDLGDVAISSAMIGDILYYDGTDYINSQPGVASGIQPYDLDLENIAGLTQNDMYVIRSNGTVWESKQLSRDDLSLATHDVDLNGFKIIHLADPLSSDDAATKEYVDSHAASLNIHAACTAATTVPLTATYTPGTIGADGGFGVGATLTNSGTQAAFVLDTTYNGTFGDRILVKDQVTQIENGIYTVTIVGDGTSNWELTRAADANNSITASDVSVGDFTFINGGTQNIGTGWVETAPNPIVIGTNNIAFTQFSSAGHYTAGIGLVLTGSQFSHINNGTAIGNFTKVSVNMLGHVTAGFNPTTLTGYGITDAQPLDSDLTTIASLAQGVNKVIISNGTNWQARMSSFDDHSDVTITLPINGNVLFYNGTNWVNGAKGSASGIQAWDADLDTIAALSSDGSGNVIKSNGTTWVSTHVNLNDINQIATTSLTNGNILYYNGTNFVNAAKGSTSGVQAWDADLDTIAALSQTSGNVIRSNGTNWQSTTLSFDDLGDAIITTPTTNQIIKYNGTNWVNATGSNISSLDDLTDVVISGVANGNVLYYNGGFWVNGVKGSASGVQAWDADLDTIAALAQGTHNLVVSNGTNWTSTAPGSTSGVQAWDADLDTIAALSQGTTNVIISNGTNWTSSTISLDTLSDTIITTPSTNQILKYNGTNWVNSTSINIVSFDDLSDVIITTPASGNVVYYNGTNWVNGAKGSASGIQAWDADLDAIAALAQGTGNSIISNGTNWTSRKAALATDISDVVITTPVTGQLLSYNGTNWVNNSTSGLYTDTITGADSITSEVMAFITDTSRSSKKLTLTESNFQFSIATANSDSWIPADTGVNGATAGLIMPYPGTIVRMTGHTTNSNGNNKNLSIYIDATENIAVVNLGGALNTEKEAYNTAVNIDFAAGDKIRVRARAGSGGSLTDVNVVIWVKWRK